jgi:hypothetical protein
MYVGLKPPNAMRFYANAGIAYASGGYELWITGAQTGNKKMACLCWR